jgi:hypothetical protein
MRTAGLSRVDHRTLNHQIAILRLKTEFSSTYHSEAGGTGGTSGTGGTEAKPEDGQIRLPKLDSRYPTPVPRPTDNTLA